MPPLDCAFLESFRRVTEEQWAHHVPRRFHQGGVGGLDWQTGTRWRGGLSDAEIETVQARFCLTFPPDLRLFLSTLHTPDPPMVGARYEGRVLVPTAGREIPDWTGDDGPIRERLDWPLESLLWSIEADGSWNTSWGARPERREEREAVVRGLAAAGPPLIPISGHRYLMGWPNQAGNPLLSMYGADVIFFSYDLRSYLEAFTRGEMPPMTRQLDRVPFWSDVIEDDGWVTTR